MSIFRKKTSSEEIPEIPSLPAIPSFSFPTSKTPSDLPEVMGDTNNQEAIKMALGSSEKISGDSGAVSSPSESLSIPPINSQRIPPVSQSVSSSALPELPKYEMRQPVSNVLPTPPVKQTPLVNPFVQAPEPVVEPVVEEKFVKKDASESIFVRIDKFNSAKRDVEEIGRDLKQITNVIEKITDIKLKEDEEITEINKTLEEIKNRINRIELDVFNRI